MRRILSALAVFLMLFSMTLPAFATEATSVTGFATVSADGSCQITITATIRLDYAVEDLAFPIPGDARGVALNGSSAHTRRSGDVLLVDLSRVMGSVAGEFPVSISYTLKDLVAKDELERPTLTLPLLSGFAYPVEKLEFTIALPGIIENKPVFLSGYYSQSIESNLTYSVSQNKITGYIDKELKDQETLTMQLEVTEEMFSGVVFEEWRSNFDRIAMGVLAAAALLYWLFFLRCLPPRRESSTVAPAGFTAGQLGGLIANQGADLTMMVFSWAYLGYLLIHVDHNGRVTLHKRMDMGNERSGFEQKYFRLLFGKRRMVDGTGYHYALLCRRAAAARCVPSELFHKGFQNVRILRILGALMGLFGGVSLGNALAGNAVLGGVLAVLLAVICCAASWLIQDWVRGLHLNGKDSLIIALVCAGLWLLLGIVSGDVLIPALMVGGQLLIGLLYAYGGRRSPSGKQLMSQVLGLRRNLRQKDGEQLKRMLRSDPDYFFTMIPHAMALGCGERFARRFGKRKLSGCPYLTTGMDGHRTAAEWYTLIKSAADTLNLRQKRLPLERLLSK